MKYTGGGSIPDLEYDVFYDLAWGGVDNRFKNDINIQLNNIQLAINSIEMCKKLQCSMFVGIGTVAEYAFSESIINLIEKQTPNDIYGAAKVSTHYLLEVISKQLQQPFTWAMLPSTFGEGRSDDNIITYTIKSLLREEVPSYGDLNQMWDFLYVSECVRALRLIGERGKAGKAYGIGSGKYLPLKEYISIIRNIINPNMSLGIGDRVELSQKTFSSCVNIVDLVRDTGFTPIVSFEDGIRRTIEYYRI